MTTQVVRLAVAVVAATTLVLLGARPAAAHVTVSPSSTTAGSASVLTFQIPHGCEGSPTTKVTIQMPDEITEATPTRNPLYTVSKETKALDEPVTADDGDEITEKVDTVTYSAIQPLPDGFRDTFEIAINVPDGMAGERLSFPTIQTCQRGGIAWTQIPAAGQDPEALDHPAPGFDVGLAARGSGAPTPETRSAVASDDGSDRWGYVGTGLGLAALGLCGVAIARTRKPADEA